MRLTLGFSPCPNDTFIFEALVHGRVDTEGLEFDWFLADVEELNRRAIEESVDITKMSFHAYARLKEILNERVIVKLDHKNMNLETDFMAGKVATTENLATAIWHELEAPLAEEGATLHCVRVEETENNYIEYYG